MEEKMYDENAIIAPPKIKTSDLPIRRHKYIIDSRDRYISSHPNPASYIIKLDEGLTDVVSAELILTDFKFNEYNINKYNNTIHTIANESFLLPFGVYDGQTIAAQLTVITPFTVTFNDISKKLTFVSETDTTLMFKSNIPERYDVDTFEDVYPTNSMGKLLGFGVNNYNIIANIPLEAPYTIDLETENYIIMYMQQAKSYQSKNNNAHNSFAIINKLENSSNGIVMFNNSVKKSFTPPIASLVNLKFKFCDYKGNLYDFQNKEHRFEIIFTSLNQTRSYSEIFH
jgi:hypothetical protein